jgi:hypothetical protein
MDHLPLIIDLFNDGVLHNRSKNHILAVIYVGGSRWKRGSMIGRCAWE